MMGEFKYKDGEGLGGARRGIENGSTLNLGGVKKPRPSASTGLEIRAAERLTTE